MSRISKFRTRLFNPLALVVTIAPVALTPIAVTAEMLINHKDYRSTAKLLLDDEQPLIAKAASAFNEDQVRDYLRENAKRFGLSADLQYLKLSRIRPSLLAKHYHFQQHINGINVDRAEIIVSVANHDNTIIRVYNSTHPVRTYDLSPAKLVMQG